MRNALIGITMALMAHTAQAGEVVAALGGSDISLDEARATGVAELSYRFAEQNQSVAPYATVAAFDAGYVFLGAGVSARQPLDNKWYVETSGQVGGLSDTSGNADPAFRASLGIGRELSPNTSVSLGIAHIATDDASFDSVTLRLHLDM